MKIELRHAESLVLLGVVANATLAVVKVSAGFWGHSDALIADGIESAVDIFGSMLIWSAIRFSGKPPDAEHPYGHGKLESLAAVAGAVFVLGAGLTVALHAGHQIFLQFLGHEGARAVPRPWTLLVLLGVIFSKEILYRVLKSHGQAIGSTAIQAEAWHHRSDALTSLAAFIGISIAIIGGSAWTSADDWAALFSCAVILLNGSRMFRTAVGEVIDEQVSPELVDQIETLARDVAGVSSVEKCRVRKSGLVLLADLHVRVPGSMSVHDGHAISHHVKDELLAADLRLTDVTVHLEPELPKPSG
ncbi:MAG: cation diffusion facilitator family transporter [Chthoniobacterales bacterium]